MTAVIEANVLLLLVAAPHLGERLARHKRLKAYTYADYKMLRLLLEEIGPPILAQPHVLTEASNLIVHDGLGEPDRSVLRKALADWISAIETTAVNSKAGATRPEYIPLGLTDAILLCLAEAGGTLVTADVDLVEAAKANAYQVKNFNHYIDTP